MFSFKSVWIHCYSLSSAYREEKKSSSKCSCSSENDSHFKVVGRKAEIITGRQSSMEKVEESNSNHIEESTYRVGFASFQVKYIFIVLVVPAGRCILFHFYGNFWPGHLHFLLSSMNSRKTKKVLFYNYKYCLSFLAMFECFLVSWCVSHSC